jgi:hypothetical protein
VRLTDTECAYIAGIIDGEGSISLQRSTARSSAAYFYPLVRVANTDKALIEWLHGKVGKGHAGYTTRSHLGCKDCYHWALASNEAIALLELVRPYLVVKALRADVVLAIWDENKAYLAKMNRKCWGNHHPVPLPHRKFREACYLFMTDLNRRGVGENENGVAVRQLLSEIRELEAAPCH